MSDRLMNRDFVLLWQGQFVSQLGSQAFLVAAMFWMMTATQSASLMGLFMMTSALPMVLLAPIGGTVADWFPRRTILILSDLISGVSVLTLAGLLYFAPSAVELATVWLFVVALLGGVIRAFFQPAISAAIPDLVPSNKLAAANSINQFSVQVALLMGQGIGGVLYRLFGAPLLFLFDGVTYLFSAASEMFIRIPQPTQKQRPILRETISAFKRDTWEGVLYVWSRHGMRNLLLLSSMVNFLLMPVVVLLPFFVELTLRQGAQWYGFLLAAISAGSVMGYVLAGSLPLAGRRKCWFLIACFIGTPSSLVVLGLVDSGFVALAILLITGILSGILNIQVLTLIQGSTPTELRGRVMSVVITLSGAIAPVGMALGGFLGDLTGKNLPLIFGLCGGFAAGIVVLTAGNRSFREFLSTGAGPED